MELNQYEFRPPQSAPFDDDGWFEALVGNVIEPITQIKGVKRFWFSRYGNHIINPHGLFRFEVESMESIQPQVDSILISTGVVGKLEKYDLVGDLGSDRYIGTNCKHNDRSKRAELVFNYLFGVSALFIDNLISVGAKKFTLENSNDPNNELSKNMLESAHHLFGNTTNFSFPLIVGEKNGHVAFFSRVYFDTTYVARNVINIPF